jgi:uncharacterized membrane protein YkvA (DUF1232 family)
MAHRILGEAAPVDNYPERSSASKEKADDKQADFYQNLRARMKAWLQGKEGSSHRWVEYLMWAPDLFHLLCKLSVDEQVPIRERAKLAGAIAYFISPIDLIPEGLLGPVGYVDDIAVAAYVLNSIVNNVGPDILKKHWAGDTDVLALISTILKASDRMVGSGVWKRLRKRF